LGSRAVAGLIPDEVFFDHLAKRRFVSGNLIRSPRELDYLQEPDVFHDVFGHVPLLAHPVFADYMQAFGQAGIRAASAAAIPNLSSLYWYTVEFGLMRDGDRLKIYGAGIVSSYGETIFALEDPSPNRVSSSASIQPLTEPTAPAHQGGAALKEEWQSARLPAAPRTPKA